MKFYGFNNNLEDFRTIVSQVDHTLFVKICHSSPCLNHLLPPVKLGSLMGLRPKGHLYSLSQCTYDFYRFSFIPRVLFLNL